MKILLTSLLLAVTLWGCETIKWPGRSQAALPAIEPLNDASAPLDAPAPDAGLVESAAKRFDDIPLPSGLTEDMDRTYVYHSSSIKIGRMVYTSREAVQDLAQFFLQKLPETGWKLDSMQQAERVEMLFTKPDMRLTVSVFRQGVGRANMVILNLTPSDGGTAF